MFAGWMSRHQLDVIEYLPEWNRVLKARSEGVNSAIVRCGIETVRCDRARHLRRSEYSPSACRTRELPGRTTL